MMQNRVPISIVIITRNEAANIADCLRSARRLSDDIVVVDSGSTDGTARLAALCGARVLHNKWEGYGAARNKGAAATRYDWILALDADERLDFDLLEQLKEDAPKRGRVYRFRRRNHWEERRIRFGTLGFERIARLYHRHDAQWNDFAVHERLTGSFQLCKWPGTILHFGIAYPDQYLRKREHYAWLSAITYARQGRKARLYHLLGAPLFDALKSYLFLGGFLDGIVGWKIARITAWYTARKYTLLRSGQHETHPAPTAGESACTVASLQQLSSAAS
ncbi:MAG: glycosyltransferase family 2 protein [Chitinophagaceae bacterium]|nr:MAG: glycosyltransferase family 2 protein [Chitinophagaceae bacterium]